MFTIRLFCFFIVSILLSFPSCLGLPFQFLAVCYSSLFLCLYTFLDKVEILSLYLFFKNCCWTGRHLKLSMTWEIFGLLSFKCFSLVIMITKSKCFAFLSSVWIFVLRCGHYFLFFKMYRLLSNRRSLYLTFALKIQVISYNYIWQNYSDNYAI